jgi:hypothetical protein
VLAAGSNQQIRTEEGKVFNDFQVFLGQKKKCLDVHLQFFGDSNIYMFGLGKTYRSFRNGSK